MDQAPAQTSSPLPHDAFADLEIPAALNESLARHRANLAELVRNLQSAGVSGAQIERSVSVIIDSYKQELTRAIHNMMR